MNVTICLNQYGFHEKRKELDSGSSTEGCSPPGREPLRHLQKQRAWVADSGRCLFPVCPHGCLLASICGKVRIGQVTLQQQPPPHLSGLQQGSFLPFSLMLYFQHGSVRLDPTNPRGLMLRERHQLMADLMKRVSASATAARQGRAGVWPMGCAVRYPRNGTQPMGQKWSHA